MKRIIQLTVITLIPLLTMQAMAPSNTPPVQRYTFITQDDQSITIDPELYQYIETIQYMNEFMDTTTISPNPIELDLAMHSTTLTTFLHCLRIMHNNNNPQELTTYINTIVHETFVAIENNQKITRYLLAELIKAANFFDCQKLLNIFIELFAQDQFFFTDSNLLTHYEFSADIDNLIAQQLINPINKQLSIIPKQIKKLKSTPEFGLATIDHQGKFILFTDYANKAIYTLNLETNNREIILPLAKPIITLTLSHDDTKILFAFDDNSFYSYDIKSKTIVTLTNTDLAMKVLSADFNATDDVIIISTTSLKGDNFEHTWIYNAITGDLIYHSLGTHYLSCDPTGKSIYYGHAPQLGGTVGHLLLQKKSAQTGNTEQLIYLFAQHTWPKKTLMALNRTCTYLAAAYQDKTWAVDIYNINNEQRIATITLPEKLIAPTMQFDPTGNYLLINDHNHILLFDVHTQECIYSMDNISKKIYGTIFSVQFDHSGKYIIANNFCHNAITLWDIKNGSLILEAFLKKHITIELAMNLLHTYHNNGIQDAQMLLTSLLEELEKKETEQ